MKMRLIVCVAGVALLAACGPAKKDEAPPPLAGQAADASHPTGAHTVPADVRGAEMLVRELNSREAAPGTAVENQTYFAADIAAALTTDSSRDEVGNVDFDYRWNAQDVEITDVAYQALPVNTDRALITVTFKNFGEAGQTFYDLCKRPDASWKILDVRSNEKPDGSVRAMLKLRPSSEATAC